MSSALFPPKHTGNESPVPKTDTPWVVEPYITVKAQGGLTPDLAWTDPVTAVCAAFPGF